MAVSLSHIVRDPSIFFYADEWTSGLAACRVTADRAGASKLAAVILSDSHLRHWHLDRSNTNNSKTH